MLWAEVWDGERGDPGGPGLLTTFNIVVDEVVREIMLEVCGTQEAHHGLGWATGEQIIIFYADDFCIVECKPIWVHTTLMKVVRINKRVGLLEILLRPRKWCKPRVSFGDNRGQRCKIGEGAAFLDKKKTRVSCKEYGV